MSSAATETTGRKMKSVAGEGAGINFIRPSKLTGPGTLVEEALYLGSTPNNFDAAKLDYKFENADGTQTVINGAGNLNYLMEKVSINSVVTVKYNGKSKIKKGKMAGKEAHSFDVLIADAE